MLFERLEDRGLAQYSYVVGCERAGVAAVVDPRRDVDVYVEFARRRKVRITHVLETHIHADFASGATVLARATGAELAVSAYDRGEQYETQFPHRALSDGDEITLGQVRLQALHTPGHTPEHLSYLVFDGARSLTEPMILLSGDFLFVGSLGRPDLLGEAASRMLAKRLYTSVRRVLARLPDGLEIAPGHGAGSMCGSGMSGRPSSTLGFERIANPYLRADLDEAAFLKAILSRVPPFPDYYRRMKALNSRGAPALRGLARRTIAPVSPVAAYELMCAPPLAAAAAPHGAIGNGRGTNGQGTNGQGTSAAAAVGAAAAVALAAAAPAAAVPATAAPVTAAPGTVAPATAPEPPADGCHVVIDLRDPVSFSAAHVPGSFGIGAGTSVSTWASWVVPYDTPILLMASRLTDAEAAVRSLVRVGLDDVRGVIEGGMDAWMAAGYPVASTPQIEPAALAARLGEPGLLVLDVRSDDEWESGRIPGARHVMAGELAERLDEVPADGVVAVICGTGYRSTVAASVLERAGRANLLNVTGGMSAWRAEGLPLDVLTAKNPCE